MIVRRVEALGKFLDTEDGKNLLAGFKRAANILRIEEKKDNKAYDGAVDAKLLKLPEEKTLAKAIADVTKDANAAVAKEDFAGAMSAMAKLRPAVDAFFDKVKVNDDDKAVRENRLTLLNQIRAATRAVGGFFQDPGLSVTRNVPRHSGASRSASSPLPPARVRRSPKGEGASGGEGSGVGGLRHMPSEKSPA